MLVGILQSYKAAGNLMECPQEGVNLCSLHVDFYAQTMIMLNNYQMSYSCAEVTLSLCTH